MNPTELTTDTTRQPAANGAQMQVEFIDPRSVTANADQGGEIDESNVAQLVDAIRDGKELPPVVVVREWMEVRDGCHRLAAAIETGTLLRAVFISSAEYRSLRADGVIDCELTDTVC